MSYPRTSASRLSCAKIIPDLAAASPSPPHLGQPMLHSRPPVLSPLLAILPRFFPARPFLPKLTPTE
jgi:hypothetical protein